MKILTIGNVLQMEELKDKFGESHAYILAESIFEAGKNLVDVDVVFDFNPSRDDLPNYDQYKNPVFINSVFNSLSNLITPFDTGKHDLFFGFCGMPTFVNRTLLEVAIVSKGSEAHLQQICEQLKTDFVCVEDRVGFVTPRVICMIINEAYFTLQEGTASREDIDLAMKLGTNYPYGPFEWAKRIGINQVIKLLDAVYQDTHDERYQVCNLLRSE